MSFLLRPVLPLCALGLVSLGCDQRHHIGDLPDRSVDGGGSGGSSGGQGGSGSGGIGSGGSGIGSGGSGIGSGGSGSQDGGSSGGATVDGGPPGRVQSLWTDDERSCAALDSGRTFCWGIHWDPPVPLGPIQFDPTPVEVTALDHVSKLASFCAALTDGTVRCWGNANLFANGELGDRPTAIPGLSNVADIGTGIYHACARLNDGQVYCWGSSPQGQVGTANAWESTPVSVPGLGRAAEIAVGTEHTCARLLDGSVWCWGADKFGQLGDGANPARRARFSPGPVAGLPGRAMQLAANNSATCALIAGGRIFCWGIWSPCLALVCDPPETGIPPTELRSADNTSASLDPIRRFALGRMRIAFITESDDMYSITDHYSLQREFTFSFEGLVSRGGRYLDVAVSYGHGCALAEDGQVYCWGDNVGGAVGAGTVGDIWPQPTLVRW